MIIKNFKSLSTNPVKKSALSIIEAGLEAALPWNQLEKIIRHDHLLVSGRKIDLKKYDKVFLVSAGKAAYSMAEAVNSLTGIASGLLIVPKKTRAKLTGKFKVIHAGHPVPNKNSVLAAKKILDFLDKTKSGDFIIFLISGGASSLVALPDGITLEEKQSVNDLMIKCGADIHEINCIRKHLSKIKGGRLLEYLRSDAISLVMSDVVGDDLSSIASGITYYDKTTFSDTMKIIKKYHLERSIPKNVLRRITLGLEGKIPETPKRKKIENYVISTNKNCLDVMNVCAKDLGFSTKVLRCISGDVKDVSVKLVKILNDKKINCIIFGGETTVVVKEKGMGGRNQELVLHTALTLTKQNKKAVIVSVGTDGIDGNTDCAGAIWQSDQMIDKIRPYLDKNNSYNFFKKNGGLVFTGQTGTNLMDIGLVLR